MGELERYRVVVESLAAEFDLMDVAMAAVKLIHQANGSEDQDEDEIPQVELDRDKPPRGREQRPGTCLSGRQAAA